MTTPKIEILLIEDDLVDANLVKEMLEKSGKQEFSVMHVQTLAEGLDLLRRRTFDIVLVDLGLPDSHGLEAGLAVRSQSRNVPIVVVTGLGNERMACQSLEMGMQDYLIKEELAANLLVRSIRYAIHRKRISDELQDREEYCDAIFSQAAVGIAQIGTDGRLLRMNRKYCDILGYTEEEMKELTFQDITHPDDRETSLMNYQRLMNGEIGTYSLEKRYIRKDSSTIWIRLSASMVFDPDDGTARFAIAFVEDITSRKRAEESLRFSEARFQALFRDNPVMIVTLNAELNMVSVNPICAKNLGYLVNELEGKSVLVLFHEDDRVAVSDQLQKCLENPYHVYSWQLRKNRKDGDLLWVEEFAQAVFDLNGAPSVLVVCQDITERKRAEDALQEALVNLERSNEDLEHFAYLASHDLKEPLRTVASYLKLLDRKYRERLDEKADVYIHYAVDGATRMQSLIEGLLEYARIGRAKSFGHVDTGTVFADATANLEMSIRESRAEITCNELPTVWGDSTLLLQLFQNLISNSIKYRQTDRVPRIFIAAEQLEREWLFSVRDNGIGIYSGDFERIFQIFQRLHTREECPGTGIGLAACKKIIDKHHGRIWVESAPGEGTTFFFTIPFNA